MQGHNIVFISNHQTEADPAVIALLLEATHPHIAEKMTYVAGDRVITDPLCKPFSMGRNLLCVYSKKHMYDIPELAEMKRKANTRSLKEMALLLSASTSRFNPQNPVGDSFNKSTATSESASVSTLIIPSSSTTSLVRTLQTKNTIVALSPGGRIREPRELRDGSSSDFIQFKDVDTILGGSQIIWIAPSGGRDRPDPITREWYPAPFDAASVDNMRRLTEHTGVPGHIYPLAVLCYDIMPPPPQVEKEIGERRLISFHGTGLSVAPEISFSEIVAACGDPEKSKMAYAKALYDSVTEQYNVLKCAIHGRKGLEASVASISLSQPWN
ncbi:phospholipid/glycerol acyltransferase family protein [Actinidia rufa]|uniref:Phospholipid/glycerol acyltransferase family protein n=1 Tax=Actinidia rufa TaxID=165716 RepID=A0A7J0GD24_9ERIC|nr:phospholipid/glycerol acyltransferase family protein [Actinidia rufa]